MAGIIVGEVIVAVVTIANVKLPTLFPTWPSLVTDLNIGLVALLANTIVLLGVSAFAPNDSTAITAPMPAAPLSFAAD